MIILNRETKANFEIRVINKLTKKSKTLSILAVDETEESLKNKIKDSLENNKNSKVYKTKEEKMAEETTTETETESEAKTEPETESEESEDSEE